MKSLPALVIDTNERGSLCNAVERNADRMGVSVVHRNLPVGDYLLGDICVEAKSIGDLFQSSHSGHLWRQLDNMDANYDRFFLVVHGTVAKHLAQLKSNSNYKVTYSKIQNELTGTLARIMADFDCQVFYSPTHSEAAQFIAKLHQKSNKGARRHGARALKRVSTNDVRADMLLTIPGFGADLVEKLLEKCGSIEEMTHQQSLKEVKGLGTALRGRLLEVLTSEQEVHVERRSKRPPQT
jgi:ERCC4-type nuclease